MREISFKAKRKDNGDWIEGFLTICDERYFIVENGKVGCLCFDTLPKEHYVFMPYIEVDQSTVSQFTGLTDKNGKKIFEGDVVAQNWYDHDEPSDDSFGEVVFCEYDCSFSVLDVQKDGIVPLGRCHAYHWEVEVIGNVHDNKSLLNNQEAGE